ncbi:formate dehydrogenase accessory sulfurtransferase FdhD [Sphingomonas histidinilytica]|uniref:formate dehydrogenase accessory sulfurtransferase FdhD n=1 Tax=Rhizorhabdus histidinilytica TaxID=439228 RepID=UPI001ADD4517|nr:formate dehydrogenase accessory sulfurtransferase FdhD [Rhizorhabdus histidinilytica]MBO9379663.1 formate dehydrogenase accessory sulfurtransferase FdhD [Rhizorhabdus histidinilytica]
MPFDRLERDGSTRLIDRAVPEEVPVAIEFNGIGYAVLMATPADIEDLVCGFALGERLITPDERPLDVDVHRTEYGIVARAPLPPAQAGLLLDRVRHRATDSSCGICGIENLEQAIRPLPRVTAQSYAGRQAIFRALDALRDHQPLNRATGAAHAAAHVDSDGHIIEVREDVGRHNAFDKLIGAMWQSGTGWSGGFALLSSRCSYELVEKAVVANCPMLVTISAPTRLAADCAAEAGLPLVVLARPDAVLASEAALEEGCSNGSGDCTQKADCTIPPSLSPKHIRPLTYIHTKRCL